VAVGPVAHNILVERPRAQTQQVGVHRAVCPVSLSRCSHRVAAGGSRALVLPRRRLVTVLADHGTVERPHTLEKILRGKGNM
jgi:hypothetical protein